MKEFTAYQIEQLRQIADQLRQKRQEQGISLDEIAVKTFIPLRLLEAIDKGQIERLPEPVFVQGFIRRYADSVGLDGLSLARSFSLEAPAAEPPITEVQPTRVAPLPPPRVEEPPAPVEPNPPVRNTPKERSLLPLLLGIAGLIALATGAVALLSDRRENQSATRPSTSAENISPSPDAAVSPPPPSAVPSPVPSGIAASPSPNPTTATDNPVRVGVSITGEASWIQVQSDGKTEFEGTLNKGEQKIWTAKKNLRLTVGNAGGVTVSYNQGAEKVLGNAGEVKEINYTPAGESTNP
jgi:cytoskeletal protein RodZ